MAVEAPIKIVLPPLHPGQRALEESPARFKVGVCGRRFGKTTYGVRQCTKGALETGGLYWWIGPSYRVASIGWKMLKTLAWQINQVTPVEVREADMMVVFKRNGGTVAIKSADNPDSLRGDKLSGVVFDEFAQIKEETWGEVIRPALSDRRGWALFIGTPKGKNWAYRLFERGKDQPQWESFKIPTALTEDGTAFTKVIGSTNPYIVADEMEQARQEMSPEAFAQEYLADFGMSQYLVYPEISVEANEWKGPIPDLVHYYGGLDFGGDTIGAHASVAVIAGLTSKDELIILDCFKQSGPNIGERQVNWILEEEQRLQYLHKLTKKAPPVISYRGDKSQMLGIQFMRRMGVNVWKTKGGPDSVSEGIELMHRRLKIRPGSGENDKPRPRLFWVKGCPNVGEDLMKYRYPEPRGEDKVEAINPLKVDDDVADAVRYMVEGVDRAPIGDPQQLYANEIPRLR